MKQNVSNSGFWRFIVATNYEKAFAKVEPKLYDIIIADLHIQKAYRGYVHATRKMLQHLYHQFDLFTTSSPRTYVNSIDKQ